MAHGTDVSVPPQQMARLDGKCCNGNVSTHAMEDQNDETSNNAAGKPPRNLSVMRHSCSSAWLSEAVSRSPQTSSTSFFLFLSIGFGMCSLVNFIPRFLKFRHFAFYD